MIKKIILVVILALSIFLCYTVVANGLEIGESLKVANYEDVEKASKSVDTLISQLVNINNVEFKTKQNNIQSAIRSYKNAKEEYEEMAAVIEAANQQKESDAEEVSMVDIYDVDFLWTVIGNYGTEEGIALKFDVVKSASSSLYSNEYTMCDLKFTVSGDYIPITEFIYHLEDDNRLGFEISNFEISKGGSNLQATFTAKNIPINSANMTEVQTSIEPSTTSSSTTDTPSTSSTDTSTNTNTTDSTATTDSTNTTNTSSSTNTVN